MNGTKPPVLSRTAAVLFVVAPVLMVAGGVLAVRFNDQDWNGTLTNMAAHHAASDVGWLLMLLSSALLIPVSVGLTDLVRASRPRTANTVAITSVLGWVGSATICGGGLFMGAMAQSPDRAAQLQVLKDFNSGRSNFVFLMCVVGALGFVALAVALARSRVVPMGAAILVGVGGAGTLLVVPGPVKALLILTAVLLLAGHVWILASLRSTPNVLASPTREPVVT
jgi:hypothetical protein